MDITESQNEQIAGREPDIIPSLFLEFIHTAIGRKIYNYLYSVIEQAIRDQGIVVFLSRKGYWLYRVFKEYVSWSEEFDKVTIVSDRYLAKWVNEGWMNRTFYIVDDTVTSGSTMYAVYQTIRKQYSSSDIITVAIFSLVTKSELKKSYLEQVNASWEEEKKYQEFLDTLIFGEVSIPASLGWLSYNQIALFQHLLTPYVIDLPLMRMENEEEPFLTREAFEGLLGIRNGWQYVDNSYRLSDIDIAEGNVENVHCGFFLCADPLFLQNTAKCVFQMVVKCHYRDLPGKGIGMKFTPFAVLKSMEWQTAKELCLKLYEGTEFGSWLTRALIEDQEEMQGEIKYGVLVYRSIVYFLSMYGGLLFKEVIKSDYNIDIAFDLELLEENSYQTFIETAEKIVREWKEEDFRDRIYAGRISDQTFEPIAYNSEKEINTEIERCVY